jgi:hypothetical protein
METPTDDFSLTRFCLQFAALTAFFGLMLAGIAYAPQVDAWLQAMKGGL